MEESTDAENGEALQGCEMKLQEEDLWSDDSSFSSLKDGGEIADTSGVREEARKKKQIKRKVNIDDILNKLVQCQHCKYFSTSIGRLRHHISSRHLKSKMYSCHLCKFQTVWSSKLNVHLMVDHSGRSHQCPYCRTFETGRPLQLGLHIRLQHRGRQLPRRCPYCSFCIIGKTLMKDHIILTHRNPQLNICSHCSFKTFKQREFRSHVEIEHFHIKMYKCGECDYQSTGKSFLKYHIGRKHFVSHSCPLCPYTTDLASHLKNHMNRNHNLMRSINYVEEKEEEESTVLQNHIKAKLSLLLINQRYTFHNKK